MNTVTRLREDELESIRVQIDHGLRESVLKSLDERGSAQELVRQQYTGRYPFELLQNANDAARATRTRGRAHFLLTDTALIVADNGAGFGDSQIEAICSLGRSSKGPSDSIGHKGLGFKSVGEITDRPQIVSENSWFQFDAERVHDVVSKLLGGLPTRQKLPIYAFPFTAEREDLGSDASAIEKLLATGFTTVVRLPFREDVLRATVEEDLIENLDSRLLLFLPHVDHLRLEGTHDDFSSEIVRDPDRGAEHVLLETNDRAEEWYIYRGAVTPERGLLEPLGESWNELGEVRFAIAVPMDGSQPRVAETFPLHVYFPTDERPGLHMAIHAEWILSMDRRQIATTPEAAPFNRMLYRAIADYFKSTVAPDLVQRTDASAPAIEALVPASKFPTGEGGTAMHKRWIEALVDSPFIPTVDGSLRRPAEIRVLPRKLPDAAAAHEVASLDPARTMRPDIERLEPLKAFLADAPDTELMSVAEFVSLLTVPTRETAESYYRFLVDWRESAGANIVDELKQAPIVLGTAGQPLVPARDTIFFPRERGDVALPDDLPVPIAHVPAAEDAQNLLRELGVKSFEWRELIREYLIKILSNREADPTERAGAMSGLRAYHQTRVKGSEDLQPILGRVLLPARTADCNRRQLRPASEMYFSAPWCGSDELEVIYGPFGEAEFLDIEPPKEHEPRQDDLDFYGMLGVSAYPRLDVAKPTESSGYMVAYSSSRHPHRSGLFRGWFQLPEVKAAKQCQQGHPQSQQLRESYRLDRHEELIASEDPVRLIGLWNQLARHWGSVYEDGLRAQFYCIAVNHVGDRGRHASSLFDYTLRSQAWVPVGRGNESDLVRPSEAWIDAAQTPRSVQARIPRISDSMFQTQGGAGLAAALRLTDAARPRVDDLLLLLGRIAREADISGRTSRELYLAARWVQRTLHDVLPDQTEPHPEPESVRLLASHGGVNLFVAQPPYADDPLLRESFMKQRPVLSADAGLTKLTRYLSLTRLDDAVVTSALAFEEDHGTIYDHVAKHINSVKPYIFAVVRAENSSAENRVRPALRRLELVVCERLSLTYQYDGTEFIRSAVCFIASRSEKHGRRTFNIGTAYLELDPATHQPHWFPLGRQLAQYLNVPTLGDAFTMLLTASQNDRERMMADRQIQSQDIAEARHLLKLAQEDEEEVPNILDSLLLEPDNQDPAASLEDVPWAARQARRGTSVHFDESIKDDSRDNESIPDSSETFDQPLPKPSPPPVDYSAVRIAEGAATEFVAQGIDRASVRRGIGGGHSTAPSSHTEQENRRIGQRGEDVAYHAERSRLQAHGQNPDSVHWVSKIDELSPYDMVSIDEDNQLIYIEVKSTKGIDPTEAFYISRGELIEASVHRTRFYIYRVTDVDASVPSIIRWRDPLGLIKEGKGNLLLAKAQMSITMAPEPEGE